MSKQNTNISELSRRYAKALFSLCKDKSELKNHYNSFETFVNLQKTNSDFSLFIKNPLIPSKKKILVLEKILSKLNISGKFSNFLKIVVQHNKLLFLQTIFNHFKDMIEEKLAPKFSKLKVFFSKNDIVYFMSYRFIGGGGTPYAIQNILPVLFNMPLKNYVIATLIGSMPSMFVTVSLGSGIERIIDKNEKLSFFNVINSPEIYFPIIGFFIILTVAFFIKKFYFKG